MAARRRRRESAAAGMRCSLRKVTLFRRRRSRCASSPSGCSLLETADDSDEDPEDSRVASLRTASHALDMLPKKAAATCCSMCRSLAACAVAEAAAENDPISRTRAASSLMTSASCLASATGSGDTGSPSVKQLRGIASNVSCSTSHAEGHSSRPDSWLTKCLAAAHPTSETHCSTGDAPLASSLLRACARRLVTSASPARLSLPMEAMSPSSCFTLSL
mmetsp:Transcript_36678/g.87122  ORF Transcript_36678/g.87122 Transcript_36678/m.87122 type:complete len:219 (-) Transcript_36678:1859-2515(-)